MTSESESEHRSLDFSLLQDFKMPVSNQFTHWEFKSEEYDDLPLGMNNKFTFYRNLKYCDLQQVSQTGEDEEFVVVEEHFRKKNKDFISKNNRMNDNRQPNATRRPGYYKKTQRNNRNWTNQIKTNFKKITVKNNWKEIKTINKSSLENIPEIGKLKVENIKTVGKLHYLNPQVERITWEQVKFKENAAYTVDPLKTADDPVLLDIANRLIEEQDSSKLNILCHPTFLMAILTLKASVYPWNIEIEKDRNMIVLENFKSSEDENDRLTYLDLFVTNENTSNNMPTDESRLKQICVTATKMNKVFHDLLASGEEVDQEELADHFPEGQDQPEQEEGEEGEENEQPQQLEKIRKYLKISFDGINVYSYVEIDGARRNSTTGELEYVLIRNLMESESNGAWIKDMKTPGALTIKEYQANSCNIQKWLCEAKLAGVNQIKTGFIGYTAGKVPVLLNVEHKSVKSFESTLSFKYDSCWSTFKYIANLMADLENGTYVLAKNPYTPLSIKLYKTANPEEDEEYEEDEQARKNSAAEK